MTISLQDFLNQILTEQGPAGLEYNVTKRFANYISPYVSEVKTDIMGNLIYTGEQMPTLQQGLYIIRQNGNTEKKITN